MINQLIVDEIIKAALIEDINYIDMATDILIPNGSRSSATVTAKESGIICGIFIFERVFSMLSGDVCVRSLVKDGDRVEKGTHIAKIEGDTRSILKGERVALNIVQRMSGIATMTSRYVSKIEGTSAKIVDTRKTTPGLRILEKYSVKVGGGFNHRFNLSDMAMLKDNHIHAAGSIKGAVDKLRESLGHTVKIEVEVETLAELSEAIDSGADIIMLDNMDSGTMKSAVSMVDEAFGSSRGRPVLEASGMVSLDTVAEIASTGVDIISVGKLTHSVKAFDISLNFNERKAESI